MKLKIISLTRYLIIIMLVGCDSSSPEPERILELPFDISQFESSNLPLMIVENQLTPIQDEPKILTKMWLIDNAGINTLDDMNNLDYGYDETHLFTGIEIRGHSSQKFAKKQYGLELWMSDNGANLNDYEIGTTEDVLKHDDAIGDQKASLLSMPQESDWVINAPYADKTLMRNYFVYRLAADITAQWQPKAHFIELIFKSDNQLNYRGVYLLTEKIKRDSNRVNINKLTEDEISGEDLTGGYIIELSRRKRVEPSEKSFAVDVGDNGYREVVFVVNYPKAKNIRPEQLNYIETYIDSFLAALYSDHADDPTVGYSAFSDLHSLVDFFLIQQLVKNKDGYILSTYFHKDKNGLLVAGPLWDFNLSTGNTEKNVSESYKGWSFTTNIIAERLLKSPKFITHYKQRWTELREGVLSDNVIESRIDTAMELLSAGAANRNYQVWNVFGYSLQGNEIADSKNHAEEVLYFRQWMLNRLQWIDSHIGSL